MALTARQTEIGELLAKQADCILEKTKLQAVRDAATATAQEAYTAGRVAAENAYTSAVSSIQTELDAINAKLKGTAVLDVEK